MKFLFVSLIITLTATCSQKGQPECIDSSKIRQDAVCIEIYKPVCGCDNKTYPNDCVATNAGVTSWTEGECK